MNWNSVATALRRTWKVAFAYVTRTTERKWTAVGVALGLAAAIVLVPPLGIAAYGGAIAGKGLVALFVVLFCALTGNRVGIAFERRNARAKVK